MSTIKEQLLQANARYSEDFGNRGELPAQPAKRMAILTCMDARLDPAAFAGLAEGDAHVIRNAGGRASDDAIRSLVISHKLLGTTHWFVIHHTDCGMATVTNEIMGDLLAGSLETAVFEGDRWVNLSGEGGSEAGRFIDWLTIGNPVKSLREDVRRIREHPLVPRSVSISGFLYDVKTGKLEEIPAQFENFREEI